MDYEKKAQFPPTLGIIGEVSVDDHKEMCSGLQSRIGHRLCFRGPRSPIGSQIVVPGSGVVERHRTFRCSGPSLVYVAGTVGTPAGCWDREIGPSCLDCGSVIGLQEQGNW